MAAVAMGGYRPHDSFPSYPQNYAMYSRQAYPTQQQPDSASSAGPSQYAAYEQSSKQARHSPPSAASPTSDDGHKPSLPSISNLLGIADGERPHHEHPSHQMRHHSQQMPVQPPPGSVGRPSPPMPIKNEHRPFSFSSSERHLQRSAVPPTPPLGHDPSENAITSPAGSSISGPPYLAASALDANDSSDLRRASMAKRQSIASQATTSSHYANSSYTNSAYAESPGAISNHSFYSNEPSYPPPQQQHPAQHPLPGSFPPAVQQPHPSQYPLRPGPAPASASAPGAPNPWEHHHYISPSTSSAFSPSQDRYICPTCNKSFSRPSSLKIHSHSHTGEKPFKCPHSGCGKAFSVRSNMKRHERGCHTGLQGVGGVRMM